MGLHLAVGIMRVLEILFFTGLIGCAAAVVLSWIDIWKDAFSSEEAPKISK